MQNFEFIFDCTPTLNAADYLIDSTSSEYRKQAKLWHSQMGKKVKLMDSDTIIISLKALTCSLYNRCDDDTSFAMLCRVNKFVETLEEERRSVRMVG